MRNKTAYLRRLYNIHILGHSLIRSQSSQVFWFGPILLNVKNGAVAQLVFQIQNST